MAGRVLPLVLFFTLAACASAPRAPVEAPSGSAGRAAGHAAKMVGKPYRFGGSSPSRGFDCSGLVQFSYRQAGMALPRTTEDQLRASRPVRGSMQRGDLLFFDQEGKKKSHVGIYLGDGKFIHASSSQARVIVTALDDPYYAARFLGARRLTKP